MNYKGIPLSAVMEKLKPLLQNGTLQPTNKGTMKSTMVPQWNTPWIHTKHTDGKKCWIWNEIFYKHFGLIHSGCQGCWKVCVRMKSLKQLVELHGLQKKLDLPSKCGIEVREHVHGLYGGYFYNDSLEEGKECYKIVRKAINENLTDGEEVKVVLKRACTEMEHGEGDSREWKIAEGQVDLEKLVDSIVEDSSNNRLHQSDWIQADVMNNWVKWAFQNGDPTYAEFTHDGQPLFPEYVTYHEDCDKELEEEVKKQKKSNKSKKKE